MQQLEMPPIHDKDTLISALRNSDRGMALLVGSPMSTRPDGSGVPSTSAMATLVRKRLVERHPAELSRFDVAMNGLSGVHLYQASFAWLQANVSQDAVNEIVRDAVLCSCRNPGAFAGVNHLDGAPDDWEIPAGTLDLASIVCNVRKVFTGPILTTNFDPLITQAIKKNGGNPIRRVLHTDGALPSDAEDDGSSHLIVHLHGYWRDSDSLHTPWQLKSPRPKLAASLQRLLREKKLLVIAYGGWDDVFMHALSGLLDDDSARVDVLWCFHETDTSIIRERYSALFGSMEIAARRGRFRAFYGIDGHSIFSEVSSATRHPHQVGTGAHGVPQALDSQQSLLAPDPDASAASAVLAQVPRRVCFAAPQYRYVREAAQSQLHSAITAWRFGWLVTDWEMGKDDFIACVLARFRSEQEVPAFSLSCDDCTSIADIESAAAVQFGISMSKFLTLAAALPESDLILDGITSVPDDEIRRLVDVLLDYCPKMRVLLVSRRAPHLAVENVVHIAPLDLPDIRKYLLHHPSIANESIDLRVVERFHRLTGGLPRHLDAALEKLRVASLEEVLVDSIDLEVEPGACDEAVPKDLVNTVADVMRSSERMTQRSWLLLKVLTLLPDGETLEAIRRTFPESPFHPSNANELLDLGLLEVVAAGSVEPLLKTSAAAFGPSAQSVKVLRVPRPVRDYVVTCIDNSEATSMLDELTDVVFGRKWRDGMVRLRSEAISGDVRYGFGNEFTVLASLFRRAEAQKEMFFIQRVLRLALCYIENLCGADRFHDAATVAEHLLQMAGAEMLDLCQAEQVGMYAAAANAMRMTGQHSKSLALAQKALDLCEHDGRLGNAAKIRQTMALAYEAIGEKDAARVTAEEMKKASPKDSGVYMHATWIIEQCENSGETSVEKAKRMESSARSKGHSAVANNIALYIAKTKCDENEELAIRMWRRVIESTGDDYNRIRGIVGLSDFLSSRRRLGELSYRERALLEKAYTYLHSQRMRTLLRRCHEVLWDVLKSEGMFGRLLRLFRHSSFFWRIAGEESHERRFAQQLASELPADIEEIRSDVGKAELEYFKVREGVLAGS